MVARNMWTRIQELRDYLDANGRSNKHVVAGIPGTGHDVQSGYNKFDLVVDSLTDKVYRCLDTTVDAAEWEDTGLTLDGVTEAGTEVFVVATEVAQLALDAAVNDLCVRTDVGIYRHNGGTAGDMTDWDMLVPYDNNGVLQVGTLAVSAVDDAEIKTTTTAYYKINGIQYSKAATDELPFSAADTINTGEAAGDYFGVWLVQINAAGVISTKSPAADQVYESAEAALEALPAVDSGNVALGSIVIGANTDSKWTAQTDDLVAASDCASITITDADIRPLPASV
jgi:hypothetical protein